jgi:hypothetical protein
MAWFIPTVHLAKDHLELRKAFSRAKIKYADVDYVYGEKIDKITYQELFLVFEIHRMHRVAIGEGDQGFENLEDELPKYFKNFPLNWRSKIETENPGVNVELWARR